MNYDGPFPYLEPADSIGADIPPYSRELAAVLNLPPVSTHALTTTTDKAASGSWAKLAELPRVDLDATVPAGLPATTMLLVDIHVALEMQNQGSGTNIVRVAPGAHWNLASYVDPTGPEPHNNRQDGITAPPTSAPVTLSRTYTLAVRGRLSVKLFYTSNAAARFGFGRVSIVPRRFIA